MVEIKKKKKRKNINTEHFTILIFLLIFFNVKINLEGKKTLFKNTQFEFA